LENGLGWRHETERMVKLDEIRLAIRALAVLGKYREAFEVMKHAPGASRGALKHRSMCLHCGWDIDPMTGRMYSVTLYREAIDSPGRVHDACIRDLVRTEQNLLNTLMHSALSEPATYPFEDEDPERR
jgi:hypothetical protein